MITKFNNKVDFSLDHYVFFQFKSLTLNHSFKPLSGFLILQLEAENFPEISHKYEISAVPTFLLFKVGNRCAQ